MRWPMTSLRSTRCSVSANDDVGVVGRRCLVERDDTVIEVFAQHGFDAFSQVGLALTIWEPSEAVEQLGDGDGCEVDLD